MVSSALRFLGLAVALTGATNATFAQDPAANYPERTVTIVVPFAAGGGTDVLARMMGRELEQKFGKTFVIENRPGAGGTIGAHAVTRAAHDGYTIFLGSGTNVAVNVSLYKKLAYDPVKEFTPLALAAATPFVLVVNPSLPVKTVKDFVAYVKERPGKINYATSGPGVPHHLFMELLGSQADLKMTMVPYKGSAPALNDVIAGHVPTMMVDIGPALGSIQGGKVRALGVTSAQRISTLSDIPPIAETYPGFDATGWFMFAGPSGMPPAIAEKLHKAMDDVLAKPEFGAALVKFGLIPAKNRSIAELQRFVVDEIERWRKVVRTAGVEGKF